MSHNSWMDRHRLLQFRCQPMSSDRDWCLRVVLQTKVNRIIWMIVLQNVNYPITEIASCKFGKPESEQTLAPAFRYIDKSAKNVDECCQWRENGAFVAGYIRSTIGIREEKVNSRAMLRYPNKGFTRMSESCHCNYRFRSTASSRMRSNWANSSAR